MTQSSSASAASLISKVEIPQTFAIPDAPNTIDDVQSIESWRELYKERRTWALDLVESCTKMDADARSRYDEIDVMVKCLDAAVANLEISVKQIEPKYNELKKWVDPALSEHERLASSWEQYLTLARNTPISATVMKFMTRREVTEANPTLEDLIELDTAKKAGKLASTAHRRFSEKASGLDRAATQMNRGLESLIVDFEALTARSILGRSEDTSNLLQDIEAVVKQIDSDYQTILGYGASQRDLAQASKVASNHTERLVPNLKKRAREMDNMLRYASEGRNSIAADSAKFMKAITDITSLHSGVRSQIQILNQSEDDMTTFDYLRLIYQLPYMYASFVVEAIRRREWIDRVKLDSSTLANEMALFQDEESKRRRKWQKMVGSMYGPELDTNVIGLEVNLHGEDEQWPSVTKADLEDFIQNMEGQQVEQAILDDIFKLVQELNAPTKQQQKRLKAFKNGSIHENALGRSGLMIRGDDDLLRSLQDDKSRMESKLKTAESRVRRLEDLLHRQSQASRPGNLFLASTNQPPERPGSSASIKSGRIEDRRRSSDGADPLLRRIAQLENDLREEKQRSSKFQKDLGSRTTQHDTMKDQIEEANSTKKDLLENMEALKREFVDERKSYEDEIKALKARLEDTEEEMDNFGESRENEKATYNETVQELQSELQRLTKDRNDEMLKAQGQVDFLRKEVQLQREKLDTSEKHNQSAREELITATRRLGSLEETMGKQTQTLQKLHADLVPDGQTPEDALDLTEALAVHAADNLAKLRNMESEVSVLRTDLEQAESGSKALRAELAEVKEKLAQEELASLHVRESLSEEKAKATALEGELAEGRTQLRNLRSQIAAGETGSETLQKRLEAEEKKVTVLTEDLATRQSRVGSLEEEVHMFQAKFEATQAKLEAVTTQYESRDDRTKDLTKRVYSQNDRLIRLLERVGYSVTRDNGEMTVTKVPRSERQAQNPNDSSDPGSSIKKSVNLSSKVLDDSAVLESLYWMNGSDAAAEADKYSSFLETLGSFNMDLFADTIYHRIKEAEHKARKWQREAKAYRDRAHSVQKDAHDKIAFKNFKEGDLALFLPTRNQQAGAWAAFNVGFPHFFLREQDTHRLRHREWLVARINRIQERVVDLSKSMQTANSNEAESGNEEENDNPFQLSDGLRWYLIDAHEDKPGAPTTPGMGKSTVAANTVEATANIQTQALRAKGKNRDSISSIEGINKTLSKSLESRRSSSGSKKAALPFSIGGTALLKSSALASETNSLRAAAPETPPTGTSPVQNPNLLSPAIAARMVESTNQDGKSGHTETAKGESSKQGGVTEASSEVRNVDSLLGP